VSMYPCIYVSMYVCRYVCICICINIYIYVYISKYVYIHIYICKCIYISINAFIYIYLYYVYLSMCIYIYIETHYQELILRNWYGTVPAVSQHQVLELQRSIPSITCQPKSAMTGFNGLIYGYGWLVVPKNNRKRY
jgi:hypothetical protein